MNSIDSWKIVTQENKGNMNETKKCTYCQSSEDLIPHRIGHSDIWVCVNCENIRYWKRLETEEKLNSKINSDMPRTNNIHSMDDLFY